MPAPTASDLARTINRLSDPDERQVRTVWATTLTTPHDRVNGGEGKVRIVLATRFNKGRKTLHTEIHTEILAPNGFVVRSFMLMGEDSAERGLTVGSVPMARFGQKPAWAVHEAALDGIEAIIEAFAATRGRAGADIAAAWAARVR